MNCLARAFAGGEYECGAEAGDQLGPGKHQAEVN